MKTISTPPNAHATMAAGPATPADASAANSQPEPIKAVTERNRRWLKPIVLRRLRSAASNSAVPATRFSSTAMIRHLDLLGRCGFPVPALAGAEASLPSGRHEPSLFRQCPRSVCGVIAVPAGGLGAAETGAFS